MAANAFVDPISRIEGHLGVDLTTASGRVTEADLHGNLWRGFENFLIGREPNDAITFTQRICGVCPVPHGMASTFTVEAALGYNNNFQTFCTTGTKPAGYAGFGVPEKALHIRNLILAEEFLMSSLTHFYHLAAPSYIQGPNVPPWTPYFHAGYYHPLLQSKTAYGTGDLATGNGGNGIAGATLPANAADGFSKDLWSAVIKQYVHALRIRRLTFEAGALFAGRMPMTSGYIAGGTGVNKAEDLAAKVTQFKKLTKEIADFIVTDYVPVVLALGALYPNYDNQTNAGTLYSVRPDLWNTYQQDPVLAVPGSTNTGWGAGVGNFLAWGCFPQMGGTLALSRGYMSKATYLAKNPAGPITVGDVKSNLREHVLHSRYSADQTNDNLGVANPAGVTDPLSETRTHPVRDDSTKYSWIKSPRWAGASSEVGPFARMCIMQVFKYNVPLATTVPGYTLYAKGAGLNPALVNPDLAVALVRHGLATLYSNGTTYGTGDPVDTNLQTALPTGTGANAAIVAAYDHSTAEIRGTVAAWILNLTAGLSTMDRLRGRAIESLVLAQSMMGKILSFTRTGGAVFDGTGWADALATCDTRGFHDTYNSQPVPKTPAFGFGAVEAPRGALMHAVHIDKGKITAYQCIVPTTWNGSPKDASGVRGPIEEAIVSGGNLPYYSGSDGGTFINTAGSPVGTKGGVEALRVAQSFDPCIACAIH